MEDRGSLTGRVVVGALLVVVGAVFLLGNLTDLDVGKFFGRFWPLFPIGFGLWWTWASRGRMVLGPILLFLGVGFQLAALDVIEDGWIGDWGWPVLLILVGVWFVVARPLGSARGRTAAGAGADAVDVVAFLGGHRERVTSRAWKGGEVTAMLGSAHVDLREALPPPDGATLEATAILGGIEVVVPRTWVVAVKGVPVLGSVDDHTVVSAETDESGTPSPDLPRLTVRATAILGSVEVKH